jgi:LEA14-like dessication related protein
MNKLLTIGIAGGLVYGAYKLIQMKSTSGKIVSSLSNPRIHKLDLSGLVFRTEIKIQNPTQSSITVTKPVVTLSTNGNPITNSNPENKTITIKPLATTSLGTIELTLPWTTLLGYVSGIITKVPAILAAYKNKDMKTVKANLNIPIEMKYSLYANNIFYESAPQKIM